MPSKFTSKNQQFINSDPNFPRFVWVDSRKQKPPVGEEVLLTDAQGKRDLGEFFPGSGWMGKKFDWNDERKHGHYILFWCRIPEDPPFELRSS